MAITFPTNTRRIINEIRSAIGRIVTLQVEEVTECPSCTLNPITGKSTDQFCPICSGEYYIVSYSGFSISGHIKWGRIDSTQYVPGGIYDEGDCTVQIEYTSGIVPISGAVTSGILDRSNYIIVDNKRMRIDKKDFRGVKELNRVILILSEMED